MSTLHSRMVFYHRSLDELSGQGPGWRCGFFVSGVGLVLEFEMTEPGRFKATVPNAGDGDDLPPGFAWDDKEGRAVFEAPCTLTEAAELAEEFLSSFAPDVEDFTPHCEEIPGYEECDVCGRPLTEDMDEGRVMFVHQALRLGVPIERVEKLVEHSLRSEREVAKVARALKMPPDNEAAVRDLIRRNGPFCVRLCPVCVSAAELLVQSEPEDDGRPGFDADDDEEDEDGTPGPW